MGGNALKLVETKRLFKDEYEVISNHVLSVLLNTPELSGRRIDISQSYREKNTFGDLDVIIESPSDSSVDYKNLIEKLFNPIEIVQNSNCYSFNINSFQVDFVLVPSVDYETYYNYSSWNDLGNLTGRIFKKLGFKYGHRGLIYVFRDGENNNNTFSEILVSKDYKQIFAFGDLDYEAFMNGFDTTEDIFRWVSSSKYFHKDIYLLHNRNNTSRTRDKKRKIYNEFLNWCQKTEGLNEYPWTQMREQNDYGFKDEFLKKSFELFPLFEVEYTNVLKKLNLNKIAKDKFNGELVSKLTNLKGKELGIFMRLFVNSVGGKEALVKLVHDMEQENINRLILDLHSKLI